MLSPTAAAAPKGWVESGFDLPTPRLFRSKKAEGPVEAKKEAAVVNMPKVTGTDEEMLVATPV